MAWKVGLAMVITFLVLAGIGLAYALSPSEIEPTEPPSATNFDSQLIVKGEQLALMGNCHSCHTVNGGRPFAGGRPIETPFGTIYGTNITPDPDTGVGRWSLAAFERAMRRGLDREGRHLYPAFPYNHFTWLSDSDIEALYAFLMTQPPVSARDPENELVFPLNFRPLLAGWKLLYLDNDRQLAEGSQGGERRGEYLVRALAHCGACHTPRNFLQGERRDRFLSGGQSEGWHAPAINAASPAAVPWTAEKLMAYLRSGWSDQHGVSAGPMAEVSKSLALVNTHDVQAIVDFIMSQIGQSGTARPAVQGLRNENAVTGEEFAEGAAIYKSACAGCHENAQSASLASGIDLSLSTSLRAPMPMNLINFVLEGVHPSEGQPGRLMPGFSGALTDQQIARLAEFLRALMTDLPPWEDVEAEIADARDRYGGSPQLKAKEGQ